VERDRRRGADLAPLSLSGEGVGSGEKLDFCMALSVKLPKRLEIKNFSCLSKQKSIFMGYSHICEVKIGDMGTKFDGGHWASMVKRIFRLARRIFVESEAVPRRMVVVV